MPDPKVVIVGAGAAGVGAGLELAERGIPFVILEAAGRVGGRARTDTESLPVAWDHGCHWLHSADVNPLVAWADRLGADYRREERIDHFAIWTEGGFADGADLREAGAATAAAFEAVDAAAAAGRDVSIADVLSDAGRWNRGVRCILRMMGGDDPERVSAAGYGDYEDTGVNWPVVSGYGDLIRRMAEGLPVRLGVPVTGISQTATGARAETADGALEASAVIVTASTNVLASGAIAFGPGPARELLDFVADVPCGAYEKVALAVRGLPPEMSGKLFCMIDPGGGSHTVDVQIMATDPPVLVVHMAGSAARDVAPGGRAAMVDFATGLMVRAFGSSFADKVTAAGVSDWSGDPFIRGSYSAARPGTAHRRRRMIAADTGTVAFAGEAFSLHGQATAHGAYESGRDAAARVARYAT